MENIINEKIVINEEKYEEYLKKVIDKMKKYKDIIILGKLLHYLEKPTFYYDCTVLLNTEYNPFDIDIQFCFEFIDGEIPYVTILTDFVEPPLNDNRNYYRCLSKEFTYKFSLDNLPEHEIILESMIKGIENFLTYLNESMAVNTFIFFGQYEYNHIYQINDFLKNRNYLNFYRINQINNKKNEEKYIIFTKLFFLLFTPTSEDNALAKLIFFRKLKDLNLEFDKNKEHNSLILKLNYKKFNNDVEFKIIDRKRKSTIEELNLVEEDEDNNERDDKSDYSIILEDWFSYLDNINFKKYDIVLSKYKILFNDKKRNVKVNDMNPTKVEEYNKFIQFNENLISLYENLKNINNNKRIYKLISNIIYICSELVDFGNTQDGKENKYILKIRKYITLRNNTK